MQNENADTFELIVDAAISLKDCVMEVLPKTKDTESIVLFESLVYVFNLTDVGLYMYKREDLRDVLYDESDGGLLNLLINKLSLIMGMKDAGKFYDERGEYYGMWYARKEGGSEAALKGFVDLLVFETAGEPQKLCTGLPTVLIGGGFLIGEQLLTKITVHMPTLAQYELEIYNSLGHTAPLLRWKSKTLTDDY